MRTEKLIWVQNAPDSYTLLKTDRYFLAALNFTHDSVKGILGIEVGIEGSVRCY